MSRGFQPDWVSAPGDTISDVLRERDLTIADFAKLMDQALEDTSDLLEGRAAITIELARRLQRVLGASVEFWMSRDYQYREDITRLQKTDSEWLSEFPVRDMVKFGWLPKAPHPADEITMLLSFFDMPSVSVWQKAYAELRELVAFRTSPTFHSRPAAVAAWLRQGELEASEIDCRPWNADQFHESLEDIRRLTRSKDPQIFIPKLRHICAESGVGVAAVRAPTGCRASGATRFLSDKKALLLLSFRYLTDDHFWFTFFHEAGHLILHARKLFLESADTPLDEEEQQANDFAAGILVPAEFVPEMLSLPKNGRRVIKFARRVGVSPGIIVGQLQHIGRIKHSQLNSLKRRYRWVIEP